jgi:hypothetical protein
VWRRHYPFFIDAEESSHWQRLVDDRRLLDRGGDGDSAAVSTTTKTTTKINEGRLVQLVTDCGGDEEGARYTAALSNARRLPLKSPAASTVMEYQQLVFPPLSGLFYSFDPHRYAADSMVYTGIFTYMNEQGATVGSAGFRLDAAVKLSYSHLVLAALKITDGNNGLDPDDMENCILVSLISALALLSVTDRSDVILPFVVNAGHLAFLFTTKVVRGKVPVIKLIFIAEMFDQGETATIVAHLAVIVGKLKQDIKASPKAKILQMDLDGIDAPSRIAHVHDNAQ